MNPALTIFAVFVVLPVICTAMACSDNRIVLAVSDSIMSALRKVTMVAAPIVLIVGAYQIGAILHTHGMLVPAF